MTSRMRLMWLRYPHVVKHRFAEYGEEPADSSSPVPVDMHIDALDLLGTEIEDYSFYPIFLPDPTAVVTRSIDIFFSHLEHRVSHPPTQVLNMTITMRRILIMIVTIVIKSRSL